MIVEIGDVDAIADGEVELYRGDAQCEMMNECIAEVTEWTGCRWGDGGQGEAVDGGCVENFDGEGSSVRGGGGECGRGGCHRDRRRHDGHGRGISEGLERKRQMRWVAAGCRWVVC